MAQAHEKIIDEILKNLPKEHPDTRLFKSKAGFAWQGKSFRKGRFTIIENAVPFYGMEDGWPDLCGWQSVTITPDMVGQTFARFVGVEVKVTGKLRKSQERFRDIILRMGGIFRVIK